MLAIPDCFAQQERNDVDGEVATARRGAASTTRSEKHARTLVYSPSRPLSSPFEEGRETQHTARWCVQREREREIEKESEISIRIREFYRNERARIL